MKEVYRKEIKYPISVLDFLRIQKRLECYVKSDSHSGKDGYCVRSLYFDSVCDQDLLDVFEGSMEKRKIRLRFYPPNNEYIRLEYKCKSGTDGIKKSMQVSKKDAMNMINGDYRFLMDSDKPLARTIYTRLMTGGYHAKVIVQYNRIAYTYPASNTRVTFDSKISASYFVNSFFDDYPGFFPVTALDHGVLEVKYDDFLVGVLKELTETLDTLPSANSKYEQSRLLI